MDDLRPDAPGTLTKSPSKEDAINQLVQSASSGDGTVFNQLLSNPFFTAGFGLAGLGAAIRYGSLGLRRGGELLKRRLLVDLEVTRHDESYDWVLNWMTVQFQNQMTVQKRTALDSIIHRFTPGLHHLQIQTARSRSASGSEQTAFALVPGHGRHILRYGNAFIAVNRERVGKSFDASGRPFETVRLTTLYHYRHVFEDIFREAHELASQRVEGKTVVYTSRNVGWDNTGEPKRRRPFESVVLEQGLAQKVLADVNEFLRAREWYLDRGIPYRRGYLLYGPPGTGKTSFVQALAGQLDFNIAMLSLSQRGLTDDLLNHLLLTVPPRTLVLLEDADAAFVNRRQRDEDGYSGATVTFSGLLNALDGVASAEERIIFMTTNHKDRLDDALVRPGRVDMSVHLGYATEWQIEKLWDRFYEQQDGDGAQKTLFLQRARQLGLIDRVSTAALQGLFLYNKDQPEGAIEMIQELASPQADAHVSTSPQLLLYSRSQSVASPPQYRRNSTSSHDLHISSIFAVFQSRFLTSRTPSTMSAPNQGRQSPEPESQSGSQQQDPPASNPNDQGGNKDAGSSKDQLKGLESNPKHPLADEADKKVAKGS